MTENKNIVIINTRTDSETIHLIGARNMNDSKNISRAVIKRLPRYYTYLKQLKEEGISRISSEELSRMMGVTASQIRQDLNHFGGFGQQGYGYNVSYLREEIGKILGLERLYPMIIIGAGNLGQALARYSHFRQRGIEVKALFDVREELIGKTEGGVEVLHIDSLEDYLKDNPAEIATIAIPKTQAVQVAPRLVKLGIRAVWNFSHVDLNLPEDVVVENVHLSESLMRLTYNYNRKYPLD